MVINSVCEFEGRRKEKNLKFLREKERDEKKIYVFMSFGRKS